MGEFSALNKRYEKARDFTMKIATSPDGAEVSASPEAPEEAECQYCGGVVILRRRKLMNDAGYSYYWRHRDNEHRDCPGRSRQG